jgi:hypothetical protein
MAFGVIENLMSMKEPADKTRIFRSLLKGQGLSYFKNHLRKRIDAKQFDQDDIIEILDQVKNPEWHESMVNANIDIFEMSHEESVSYFKASRELGEDQAHQRSQSFLTTSR